ncbi:MAG: U32 family peptidase [Candidatus Falkowbacteria bacterium]|nr:U32 family peptidase [Candidatus Falkowbacteria bacterium]
MDNQQKINLELLAPARNLESGKLAIEAGADAVYIAGPNFGARQAAGNSLDDIKKLADFAHLFGAKVYLVLNTILFNEEIPQAQKIARTAYDAGVDAYIVQDFGLVNAGLPPLPLFSSTQMNNRTPEQVVFLEELGFSRAILARELSLEQIQKIHSAAPKIALETFVAGALCVSYSGNCYFSQSALNRSANRGACAQLCRQTFTLRDAQGQIMAHDKFLLSLKDLNLGNKLDDLLSSGVTSFKIEGRLKDNAYVANMVSYFRQELDKIINVSEKYQRASLGRVFPSFVPDPAKTFNRGFTEYLISGKIKGSIASLDSQKSLGKFIGKVQKSGRGWLVLDREHKLKNGDGICFLDKNGNLSGAYANAVKEDRILLHRHEEAPVGAELYCNQDLSFEKSATSGLHRAIGLKLVVEEKKGEIFISAQDEQSLKASVSLGVGEIAEKPEAAELAIKEALAKLGETIFYCEETELKWQQPKFFSRSSLNEARRQLVEKLLLLREKSYVREESVMEKTDATYYLKKADYSFNISNDLARDFWESHGVKVEEDALELQMRNGKKPKGKVLMTTKHCLKREFGYCPKNEKSKGGLREPLYLEREGKKYPLNFDCRKCQMEVLDLE